MLLLTAFALAAAASTTPTPTTTTTTTTTPPTTTPTAPTTSALDLVDDVLEKGCAPRLLNDGKYPFWEAQSACDAYLTLALVDEASALDDPAQRIPYAAAVHSLVADVLKPSTQRPFRGTGFIALDVIGAVGVAGGDVARASVGRDPASRISVPKSVLYRGYLLLMLSGLAKLDALEPDRAALYDALAQSLVDDLAASPYLASFPNGIWPCDHALAAAGLVLHGSLRGSPSSSAAGHALAARLDALRASKTGFASRVDGKGRVLDKDPRGTVLAWTAGFLGLAHLDEAARFSDTLVDTLCGDPMASPSRAASSLSLAAAAFASLPVQPAACREWPRGSKKGEDAVSGPIVMGWGTGASALAIAATRINGNDAWAQRLSTTSSVTLALLGKKRGPLEDAILLWGNGARPWL